jgi:hypothetical protein
MGEFERALLAIALTFHDDERGHEAQNLEFFLQLLSVPGWTCLHVQVYFREALQEHVPAKGFGCICHAIILLLEAKGVNLRILYNTEYPQKTKEA